MCDITKELSGSATIQKFSNLTTGVGTRRFAAPEQLTRQKKGSVEYGPSVDMYSLGVTLLDMFRNHNISFRELDQIHDAMLKGIVEPSIAKKMP
jgi:serine/threonine protein kinase